ncbi:MAG: hypothetical protein CEO21_294 [Microgenomates group bacterium Gr01-1014_80]|nr:MAG: hypothetical protein CEO21_294 [Microgenomates group bacterium Gr01-1014_80]
MILIPLFAAIAPFILWPIEIFFPYPHIVEELTKALLISLLLKSQADTFQVHSADTWKVTSGYILSPSRWPIVYGSILIGFLFALSETILYMFNINGPQTLFLRFALTMPMHIITSLVILGLALINKKLIFMGIVAAATIHYYYNLAVASGGLDFIKFINLVAR